MYTTICMVEFRGSRLSSMCCRMNHYSPRTTLRSVYNRNPEGKKKLLCVSYNNEPCHYSKKNSDDFFKSEAVKKKKKIDFQSLMCSIQYL